MSTENLKLFREAVPRKIALGLRTVSEPCESNGSMQGKYLQLRDITDPCRHVIVDFDVEGRLRNIKLGRESFVIEVKILERNFDGAFYIYSENCENLKHGHDGIYYYYDYYEEEIYKDLEMAEILVRSLTSFLESISKTNYRTTDTMIFTELKTMKGELDLTGKMKQIPMNLVEILKNAYEKYNWEGLLKERLLFRRVYPTPTGVLPPEVRPDQDPTFAVLQITQGCWVQDSPRGACKFCSSYRGVNYREKSIDEVTEHINHVKEFTGRGWKYVRKLFLSDADPLHTRLDSEVYLKFLAEEIPQAVWYETFVSTPTILSKSEDQWRRLKYLGLKNLYWGVESADDETLTILGKSHDMKMLYKAAYRLNSAGISHLVIVMSGIGALSPDRSEEDVVNNSHMRETAKFIHDTNCQVVYISKFEPQCGTEIFNMMQHGRLKTLSPAELEMQHRMLVKMIKHDSPDCEVRGAYGIQFAPPRFC